MAEATASVEDYRSALYACQRALMHVQAKWVAPHAVQEIIDTALTGATHVLEIGRDESNEQVAT